MASTSPEGFLLIVSASYDESLQSPAFVQVMVAYPEPIASQMPDSRLQEVIELAKEQLEPEFEVMGFVDRLPGVGADIVFFITQLAP